jgi:hypothetical protein
MQTAPSSIFERAEKIGEFSQSVQKPNRAFIVEIAKIKMCKFKQSPSNTHDFM